MTFRAAADARPPERELLGGRRLSSKKCAPNPKPCAARVEEIGKRQETCETMPASVRGNNPSTFNGSLGLEKLPALTQPFRHQPVQASEAWP